MSRVARPLLLAATLVAAALGASLDLLAEPVPSSSLRSPSQLAAGLSAKYRDWLDEVALLISAKERAVFLALKQDYQRDEFIRRFWEVRDPYPETPRNELREQWEARLKLARDRYGGVTEDRSRMLLVYGEPGQTFKGHCSELLPLEVWSYDHSALVRGSFTLVFYSALGGSRGPYRLWHPSEGLLSLLATGAQRRGTGAVTTSTLASLCPEGDEIAGYLSSALDWDRFEAGGHGIKKPSEEWLSTFTSYSTEAPAGAQALPAQLAISFPGRYGSRTVIQGVVSVPKASVEPERLLLTPPSAPAGQTSGQMPGETAEAEQPPRPAQPGPAGPPPPRATGGVFYDFLVDGEVVLRGELFEHFRYRFTIPEAQVAGASMPLVFQRYLRPGAYTLVVKVQDPAGKRCFRDERELEVPAVTAPSAPPPPGKQAASGAQGAALEGGLAPGAAAQRQSAANPAEPGADSALAEANGSIRATEETIRLLPMPQQLLTGVTRVEATVTGQEVARVRFVLDGRPLLAKSRPPYSIEVNLGSQPRTHLVKAVAESASGERLAEDQLLLNAGPHRFSVRLVEPQADRIYRSSLRAQAEVEVPEGEKLDRVEFYLDEGRVATLYQAPFAQPILLPRGQQAGFVRVVAYLAGGASAEDLVLINNPNPSERLDIEFVELYTTVTDRRGRPVTGLSRDDFQVFEDGVPQTVRRFERVEDLSIYAGVMIDISGSMEEHLQKEVDGALRFFQTVIKAKDRAAVITFNGKPNLAVRFTNDAEVLAGGLAGLTADGNTVLYDSIIYALYYFGGVRGKRAIVLLTDGKDEGSHYSYSDALDYARRSGVAFYTVGIGVVAQTPDVRFKLIHLADETGGRAFFIEHSSDLQGIYSTVEAELRSQYMVAYQSSKPGNDGKFRSVEVKLVRPGLEAKTLRGYYP